VRVRVRPGRPGRYKAIALAVLVHVAIIGLLVVSFRWSSDAHRPSERVIQATALKAPPDDKPPKPDESEKRAAEEAKKKADAARKKAEAERKKREALAAEKRKEEERKQRAAEEAKKKADAERKKKEADAAKKRAESAEAERRKKEAEHALQESLAAEERSREEAARAARAATELERYKALIIQRVERNWSKPPSSKGLQCVLKVRVVPGGEIVAVSVVQSSGNAVFDNSVQNAVYKSTPLPLPADPSLFEYLREIEFTFRPPEG